MVETLLSNELTFLSQEARQMVLEALSAALHNKGYGLQNTTAATDVRWLAQAMYQNFDEYRHPERLEERPAAEQQHWEQLARSALDALPALMTRVSNRCILMSQALRDVLQGVRQQSQAERSRGKEPA